MIGLRQCVYLVNATGPSGSSPGLRYITTRQEQAIHTPCEDFEVMLAAGSPAAVRAATRLLRGQCESGLRYAREMAAEDTIFVDAC